MFPDAVHQGTVCVYVCVGLRGGGEGRSAGPHGFEGTWVGEKEQESPMIQESEEQQKSELFCLQKGGEHIAWRAI